MNRILIVLSANRPDISGIDFACRLADFQGARISGILVENMLEEAPGPKSKLALSGGGGTPASGPVFMDTEQSVRLFEETCLHRGLEGEAEVIDRGALPHVLRESHFADLLVLSPATRVDPDDDALPSSFTRDLLRGAACPVLLAPQVFDGIDETIFCYDGSASALAALKAYTCLFPGLAKEKLTILEVGPGEEAVLDEAHRSLMKWAECHYDEVRLETLEGDPQEELFQYLFLKQRKMLVLGAFGRSLLSTLFRESTAEQLIRTVDLPMFLSHQ
ncbi:MAG: universal stress protein [Chitinophagaceae bacterium]|nr:MAG: universal stress protein [Chitinophagaceae bacterium]